MKIGQEASQRALLYLQLSESAPAPAAQCAGSVVLVILNKEGNLRKEYWGWGGEIDK